MYHFVFFPECSCDRRGTEVTQCPLGSPCFCNSRTGQCPCRTGVMGALCDECEDGYWNLDGASGCQPCSCDTVNSFSNICNKARGPTTTETVLSNKVQITGSEKYSVYNLPFTTDKSYMMYTYSLCVKNKMKCVVNVTLGIKKT